VLVLLADWSTAVLVLLADSRAVHFRVQVRWFRIRSL